MELLRFNLGPMDNNTYAAVDSGECLVIDPTFDSASIIPQIEARDLHVTAILNTHAHLDHVLENALFMERFGVPLGLHQMDSPLLQALDLQAAMLGLPAPRLSTPSFWLKEGESVKVGSGELRILHTPGHSPGHVSFLGPNFAVVGDVLFYDSIGRTDLPGGSQEQLLKSIREKLLPLPDTTIVYPGHGQITTIGRERAQNPFLNSR